MTVLTPSLQLNMDARWAWVTVTRHLSVGSGTEMKAEAHSQVPASLVSGCAIFLAGKEWLLSGSVRASSLCSGFQGLLKDENPIRALLPCLHPARPQYTHAAGSETQHKLTWGTLDTKFHPEYG